MGLFDRVHSGQKLRIPYSDYNAMVEAALRMRTGADQQTIELPGPGGYPLTIALVRNDCLDNDDNPINLDRFGVIGLGDPLILPADNLGQFQVRPGFAGHVAGEDELHGNDELLAITLAPIPGTKLGAVAIAGVLPVKLFTPDGELAQRYAEITSGTLLDGSLKAMAGLRSAIAGQVRVLWADPETDEESDDPDNPWRWAYVRLGDDAGGFWAEIQSENSDGSYVWQEAAEVLGGGSVLVEDGRAGESSREVNGTTGIAAGTIVWMRPGVRAGYGTGTLIRGRDWLFAHCCGGARPGSSSSSSASSTSSTSSGSSAGSSSSSTSSSSSSQSSSSSSSQASSSSSSGSSSSGSSSSSSGSSGPCNRCPSTVTVVIAGINGQCNMPEGGGPDGSYVCHESSPGSCNWSVTPPADPCVDYWDVQVALFELLDGKCRLDIAAQYTQHDGECNPHAYCIGTGSSDEFTCGCSPDGGGVFEYNPSGTDVPPCCTDEYGHGIGVDGTFEVTG